MSDEQLQADTLAQRRERLSMIAERHVGDYAKWGW